MDFSIYFFGNSTTVPEDVYAMIRKVCVIADQAKFKGVWFPERHFDAFGGFSPNPATLAAAVAAKTKHLEFRASVILPLHHPVRVAEEWAVVDNISKGRFGGLALAPGWHKQDFAMAPDTWGNRKEQLYTKMVLLERFWQGNFVGLPGVDGEDVFVKTFPKPISPIRFWFTSLGSEETIFEAGRRGVGLLTNLLKQDILELKKNIASYRSARSSVGLKPEKGHVVVLLHAFLAKTTADAKATARNPLKHYISSSMSLIEKSETTDRPGSLLQELSEPDRDYLLTATTERFLNHRTLIGDVATAQAFVTCLKNAGVDEIACFVDFGVPYEELIHSVRLISQLTEKFAPNAS